MTRTELDRTPAATRLGTLRLLGPGVPDTLDPVCATKPAAAQLARLHTRQLFTYRADPDPRSWRSITPVPDLAAVVPSIYNAGVGASNRSYMITLRRGVYWDTTPEREVTAHDVVRGLKRLGNPVRPAAALPYLTSAIRGMAEYCAGYAAAVPGPDPTAAQLAAYQNAHDIAGVLALDDETLVVELVRPALDVVAMLALPCASPAPAEYDAFVPGDPDLDAHLRSTGPYRPVRAGRGGPVRWEANPAWREASDPVRARHLTAVELTPGPDDPGCLADAVRDGAADLAWNAPVTGPRDGATPTAHTLDPYLVLNTHSPRAGSAMGRVAVRRAVACAVDRRAVAGIVAEAEPGFDVRIATSLVPPGSDGHRDDGIAEAADPARARRLLAEAGLPDGVELVAIHPRTGLGTHVARCCADALGAAGISVRLVGLTETDHERALRDPARVGGWDLATAAQGPDWLLGNARVFVQSAAHAGGPPGPEVDELIGVALDAAADPARAAAAWRVAEDRLLTDAVVVPLLFRAPAAPPLVGDRVRGAAVLPTVGHTVDLLGLRWDGPG